MSDTPRTDELRNKILSEKGKGNIVFHGLPNQLLTASLVDFVKQPADGMLYDLNRLEEVSLTFLDDPKWINDFAVALTLRKLVEQRDQLERELAAEKEARGRAERLAEENERDAERYRLWRKNTVLRVPSVTEQSIDGGLDAARKEAK